MEPSDDRVITTGIDRLMDYLDQEGKVPLKEAADSLGNDEETVLTWARALEDAGLVTVTFSARQGKVLRRVDAAEPDHADAVRERASEKVERAREWSQEQGKLSRFEDALDRLQEMLEEEEEEAERVRNHLDEIEAEQEFEEYEDDVTAAEADIDELQQHLEELKQDIDVLKQLEKHASAPGPGLLGRVKRWLSGLLPGGGAP